MILFRKLKAVVPPVSACTLTTFSATPALADGFQRANTVMQKSVNRAAWSGGNHDHRGRDLDWL